jgi:MscS family membrane protein
MGESLSSRSGRVPAAVVVLLLSLATAVPDASAIDRLAQALPGTAPKSAASPGLRPQPTPEPRGPADDFGRGTPRSALRGFLAAGRSSDWQRAAAYLDLRRIRPAERASSGPELARELSIVLDRTLWVDLGDVVADPLGATDDGLPKDQELIGSIQTGDGVVDVLLQRVRRDDGERIWKVAPATVEAVPALYEEFGYGRLGEILPQAFFDVSFLAIQLWQWVGLVLLLALAALVAWLGSLVVVRILTPLLRRAGGGADVPVLRHVLTPARLVTLVLLFAALRRALALAKRVDVTLHAIEGALVIFAATWVLLRLVDAACERISVHLRARGQYGVMPLVRPTRRGVKLVVAVLASIVALDNLGFNVTALVAGLGVGGIAVALAAQKSLENLFGAITLFSDQPVRVGNFCGFDGRVGTVEEIGLRSTRLRTLERTVVAIPNAQFAGMQLENYDARDKIWFHPTLHLRCDTTPDQVRWLLVEVRRMLYAHPKVDPDPARIRFVGFGEWSLDLEVFAYVATSKFDEYLEVAEDLNLRIMDLVARAGTALALPAQSSFVENAAGIDRERARSVSDEVGAWRARGELFLPSFPSEQVHRLADTLDYPPSGSPAARAAGNGSSRA